MRKVLENKHDVSKWTQMEILCVISEIFHDIIYDDDDECKASQFYMMKKQRNKNWIFFRQWWFCYDLGLYALFDSKLWALPSVFDVLFSGECLCVWHNCLSISLTSTHTHTLTQHIVHGVLIVLLVVVVVVYCCCCCFFHIASIPILCCVYKPNQNRNEKKKT